MTDVDSLWRRHRFNPTESTRHALIEHYLYLVDQTFNRRFPDHSRLDVDKIKGAGKVGLIKAFDNFDPARNVKFTTYAIRLIRGEMLEDIRTSNWIPRSVVDMWRDIDRAVRSLTKSFLREPTDEEVVGFLEWPVELYTHVQASRLHGIAFSLDQHWEGSDHSYEASIPDPGVNVLQNVLDAYDADKLHAAIEQLTPREVYVIRRYLDGISNKEIALELQRSDGSIYSLFRDAVTRLRSKLDPESFWKSELKKPGG